MHFAGVCHGFGAAPSFAVGLQTLVLEGKKHFLIKLMPKISVQNQVLHDRSITKKTPNHKNRYYHQYKVREWQIWT